MFPIQRLQIANFLLQQDNINTQDDLQIDQAVQIRQQRRRRTRRAKAVWVWHWLQRRPLYGQYEKLMVELEDEYVAGFSNLLRMDPAMFHKLIQCLGDRIRKQNIWYRKALRPGLKMAIKLVAGDNYHSLMYSLNIA